MQQGYYMRQFGPSYVYLKFRCSRCKKLGEHFIKQEDWEEGLLKDSALEVNAAEKSEFEKMGKITIDEMINFHYALDGLEALPKRSTASRRSSRGFMNTRAADIGDPIALSADSFGLG